METYNQKINSLKSDNVTLEKENSLKLDMVGNTAVISKETRLLMNETLAKVDASKLAGAKNLKDSLNLAVAYNLKQSIDISDLENSDDVNINIEQTVVMISVSDKLFTCLMVLPSVLFAGVFSGTRVYSARVIFVPCFRTIVSSLRFIIFNNICLFLTVVNTFAKTIPVCSSLWCIISS